MYDDMYVYVHMHMHFFFKYWYKKAVTMMGNFDLGFLKSSFWQNTRLQQIVLWLKLKHFHT